MRSNSWFLLGSLINLALISHPTYASFPLPPRISALAYASDYTVGQADVMLPILGNPNRNNLYIDPALSYDSDNQGAADIGVGYRWIAQQAAILGGYLFGGYSRIDNNARLWVVNPGIEAMGSRWDAHLNAYFPMGDRHSNVGSGSTNDFFSGHSQFGSVFLMEQFAGNGVDAKVAYQLFPGSSLKGYLGSYYFSPAQTNNIWGGAAGVEYWLTQNVKMVGSYTYDNLRRSTYAFGIGLEWGGTRAHRVSPDLEERLTDPVERYLAELGHGSKIPSRIKDQSTGGTVLLANNIAFFSQTGGPNNGGVGLTIANCTFENPCGPTDFTQTSVTTLGGLLPNTQMYFNGGTYTNSNSVTLDPGQSLQSRTADYSQPATGAARSTINRALLNLQGNNTVENMILLDQGSFNPITISGANNVITGTQIGSPTFMPETVILDSGINTKINDSVIFAGATAYEGAGSTAVIENSVFEVNNDTQDFVNGILLSGNSNVTVNNTQIIVNSAGHTGPNQVVYGIETSAGDVVNVNNSTVSVNTSIATNLDRVYDILNNGTTTVNGGALSANSNGINVGIVDPTGSNPATIQGGTVCQVNGATIVCP